MLDKLQIKIEIAKNDCFREFQYFRGNIYFFSILSESLVMTSISEIPHAWHARVLSVGTMSELRRTQWSKSCYIFCYFVWLFGLDSKPSLLLGIKQNQSWSCDIPSTSISSEASGAHMSSALQVTGWHDSKVYLYELKNTLGTLFLMRGKVRSHPYPAWLLSFKDVAFLILSISHGTGITLGVLGFRRTENSYPFC